MEQPERSERSRVPSRRQVEQQRLRGGDGVVFELRSVVHEREHWVAGGSVTHPQTFTLFSWTLSS